MWRTRRSHLNTGAAGTNQSSAGVGIQVKHMKPISWRLSLGHRFNQSNPERNHQEPSFISIPHLHLQRDELTQFTDETGEVRMEPSGCCGPSHLRCHTCCSSEWQFHIFSEKKKHAFSLNLNTQQPNENQKHKNTMKREEDATKQAPPWSFCHWRFFSLRNGLEQPESHVLKRLELLQPAAETFDSFGGEQHLSGNLSKGALGSDGEKSCELRHRFPKSMSPADASTCLALFCPPQRWPAGFHSPGHRDSRYLFYHHLNMFLTLVSLKWHKWGKMLVNSFNWSPPICVRCWSRWWQTCQKHFSPPWFSLNRADVRSNLGNEWQHWR